MDKFAYLAEYNVIDSAYDSSIAVIIINIIALFIMFLVWVQEDGNKVFTVILLLFMALTLTLAGRFIFLVESPRAYLDRTAPVDLRVRLREWEIIKQATKRGGGGCNELGYADISYVLNAWAYDEQFPVVLRGKDDNGTVRGVRAADQSVPGAQGPGDGVQLLPE